MTGEALKALFTMPAESLSMFTNVGQSIATGYIGSGWKIIAVAAVVWGAKFLLTGTLKLFKRAAY